MRRCHAVLVLLAFGSCGEVRHVCKTSVRDQRLGEAAEAVGVGPAAADAQAEGRRAACRHLGEWSPEARTTIAACTDWRIAEERSLPTQDQVRVWHVCSWNGLDGDGLPFEEPTEANARRINEGAAEWRSQLVAIRDAYVETCMTDDDRYTVSHSCEEKGWLHDTLSPCGAFH